MAQEDRQAEYISRINRVLDHIEAHLDEKMTLEELARVASFSPYHFHRIFGVMTGETLGGFIGRVRLERAASKLLHSPRTSVTEIALDCGFSSPTTFSRAFKAQFGMSATEWRRADRKIRTANRNQGQPIRNPCEDFIVTLTYPGAQNHNMHWRVEMKGKSNLKADVEVKEIEDIPVAYVRHVGPYKGDAELFGRLFGKLMQWAGPRGLINPPESKIMSLYHDDPEITEEAKLRVSACISVPETTEVDGEVGKMTVPGGTYAVARFEITVDQYPDAWNAVFGGWLPGSGYQPADSPCFELYLSEVKDEPGAKCDVEIWVPVKPL